MFEIKKYIRKNERILLSISPTWISYIVLIFIGLFMLFSVITSPLAIFGFLYLYLKIKSTKYFITNKRVVSRVGILSENLISVSFEKITSVHMKQGVLGKILGFGDIRIDTTGDRSEFIWKNIKNPLNIKNQIEDYIDNVDLNEKKGDIGSNDYGEKTDETEKTLKGDSKFEKNVDKFTEKIEDFANKASDKIEDTIKDIKKDDVDSKEE